jgi:prevent-host-death family protein
VSAHDAKTNLAQLLDQVEQGETVVITRHGAPVAKLVTFSDPMSFVPHDR